MFRFNQATLKPNTGHCLYVVYRRLKRYVTETTSRYSYCAFSYIRDINQQIHLIKYRQLEIIKRNS
jgi:hypothetical protein